MPRPRPARRSPTGRRPWYRIDLWTALDRLYQYISELFTFDPARLTSDRSVTCKPELTQLELRWLMDARPLPYPVIFAGSNGGAGSTPAIVAYAADTGEEIFSKLAYDSGFTGGVRVAAADFSRDGFPDLLVGPGWGGAPNVRILDGKTGNPIAGPLGSFWAFEPTFNGGVNVASADVDADGVPDAIITAGVGGGPRVKVLSGATGGVIADFFALDPDFRGGISVAAADLTGDGKAEIAIGAGEGGGPRVMVFDVATQQPIAGPLGSFFAYDPSFRGGVMVGASALAGDVDADGTPDLAVSAGPGMASSVTVFSGDSGGVLLQFSPFGSFTGGVRTALAYCDDDQYADVVAGSGPGMTATVRVFSGLSGEQLDDPIGEYEPFGASTGGLTVAASNDPVSIALTVWYDTDADTIIELGEGPASGVTVTLSKGGIQISSGTTDGSGGYIFGGLDPNTDYVVDATAPGGYASEGPYTVNTGGLGNFKSIGLSPGSPPPPPPAPMITGISTDTGSSDSDFITNDTSLTIVGTGTDDDPVSVYGRLSTESGFFAPQTDIIESSAWSVEFLYLAEGTHEFVAVVHDEVDPSYLPNYSGAFTVVVDLTGPTINLAAPASTYETVPEIRVAVADLYGIGTTVTLDVDLNNDNDFTGKGESNYATGTLANGAARFTDYTPLTVGTTVKMRARALDLAGNEGTSAVSTVVVGSSGSSYDVGDPVPERTSAPVPWFSDGTVTTFVPVDVDRSPEAVTGSPTGLMYVSNQAGLAPVVQIPVQSDNALAAPTQVVATLTWDGSAAANNTFSGAGLIPGAVWTFNLQPASGQSTGLHTYTLAAFIDYPGTGDDKLVTLNGSTFVINRSSAATGAGWAYADVDRLVSVTGGLMRVFGNGQWSFYESLGGGAYDSPPGDAGTLAASGGGWLYTLPSGEQRVFDSSGYQTKWVAFDGSATVTYTYDVSNRLETVKSPDGGVATFAYSGSLLETVTAPGNRVTTFSYTGSDLTLVTDPAGGLHTFAYDGSHRLTDEQWGNLRTTYGYLSDLGVRRTAGAEVNTVQPMLGASLTDPSSRDVYVVETDGLGRETRTLLDELGYPVKRIDPDGATWAMTRDAEGRLATITDPLGRTTTYTRDGSGYVTAIQNPDATRVTFTYQVGHHALTSTVDELNRTTAYTYTGDGNLETVTDPTNAVTTLTWSGGLLQTITDPLGRVVTQTYDAFRRLTNALVAEAQTGTMLYDAWGHSAGITDPLNATTTIVNDAVGRPVSLTTPDGATTTAMYDAAGLMVGSVLPSGLRTSFAYNAAGRETSMIEGVGGGLERRSTFVYDAAGQSIAVIDALGQRTTTGYDAMGRVAEVTNPLLETSQVRYDLAGNAIAALDPLGRVTQYGYDSRNRPVTVTDSLGNTTTSVYDAAGNRTAVVDPLNHRTTAVYDALNRVIAVVDPLGNRATAVYDAAGQLIASVDPLGNRTTTTYDARGNLRTVVDPLLNTTTASYDAADRLVAVTDPLARTSTSVYDTTGRVIASVDPLGNRATAVYDSAGRLSASIDPLGNRTTAVYDALDRISATIDALNQRTTAVYDALDRVVANIDALGNRTTAVFDAADRVVAMTDPLNHTSTFAFDGAGNLVAATDPRGNATVFAYNGNNLRTNVSDPLGNLSTVVYDAASRPVAATDPLNRTTTAVYDDANRLTAVVDALGNRTTAAYDAAGNVVATADPLNHVTTSVYDALNRVVGIIDPLGNRSTVVYDAAGQAVAWVNALEHRTTNVYDAAGRIEAVIDARGNRTTSVYDAAGNAIAAIDALGNRSTIVYDALNRIVASVDPFGNRSTLSYDAVGRVSALVDPLNHRVTYNYDAAGRRTSVLDGLEHTWQTLYDAAGNAVTSIDPLNGRTTAVYDADNRVTALIDPVGNRTTWTYDAAGQVVTETDPLNANRTYAYDAVGRLRSATDRLGRRIDYTHDGAGNVTAVKWYANGGGLTQTQTFTYDAGNNLTAAIDPDGTYTLSYDTLNRVQHVDELFGLSLTFGYDALGNRTSVVDSLGAVTTVTFDERNLQTAEELGGVGITPLKETRSYRADGSLDTITRYKSSSGWQTIGSTTHAYDAAGRLAGMTHRDGSSAFASYAYDYDAADRMTSQTINGSQRTYTYDVTNQLTGDAGTLYTYDANGNRTLAGYATGAGNRMSNDGTWTYTYDAEGNVAKKSKGSSSDTWQYGYDHNNQLVTATYATTDGGTVTQRVTYVYDAFGNRVERDAWDGSTATVERFGMDGWDPAKTTPVGNENFDTWADLDGSNALVSRRVYGPGFDELIARESAGGAVGWYITDHLGSVRGVVDGDGVPLTTIAYDAWGTVLSNSSPGASDRFGFTGREWDSIIQLWMHRARLRGAGAWYREDPTGFESLDLNLNRYGGNSPLSNTDPSGLFAVGHHWVPVSVITDPKVEKWLSAQAYRMAFGAYSGPTSPGHNFGTYGNVTHYEYNAIVKEEMQKLIASKNGKSVTGKDMEDFINNIKAGKNFNGTQDIQKLKDFNDAIAVERQNYVKVNPGARGFKNEQTPSQWVKQGEAYLKGPGADRVIKGVAIVTAILTWLAADSQKALAVAADSQHFRRAVQALSVGEIAVAERELFGAGESPGSNCLTQEFDDKVHPSFSKLFSDFYHNRKHAIENRVGHPLAPGARPQSAEFNHVPPPLNKIEAPKPPPPPPRP